MALKPKKAYGRNSKDKEKAGWGIRVKLALIQKNGKSSCNEAFQN